MKIIKTKRKKFILNFNKGNIDLFKRIYHNIKFFLDSNYYLNIFIGLIIDNILGETIKNENGNWEEYLNYLSKTEKDNEKIAFFNYIYETRRNIWRKLKLNLKKLLKLIKD